MTKKCDFFSQFSYGIWSSIHWHYLPTKEYTQMQWCLQDLSCLLVSFQDYKCYINSVRHQKHSPLVLQKELLLPPHINKRRQCAERVYLTSPRRPEAARRSRHQGLGSRPAFARARKTRRHRSWPPRDCPLPKNWLFWSLMQEFYKSSTGDVIGRYCSQKFPTIM